MLQQASFTHPYIDSYYNRRDHSIMLVLSNPFNEAGLSNYEEHNVRLFSNVGFRYVSCRVVYVLVVDLIDLFSNLIVLCLM